MRGTTQAAVVLAMAGALASISSAAENRIDLAALITKVDAQTALGEAVKDPQARSEESADGYYSKCNYYSENPGRSLVLRVRLISTGQLEPKKQLEEMSGEKDKDKFKPVTGLGDKAAATAAWNAAFQALPRVSAEKPNETQEHAIILQRLGRVDEAHQLNQRLAAMGYRLREVTDLKR